MNTFTWYLPKPEQWIRCEIVWRFASLVHVRTWEGVEINNLRVIRKLSDGAELIA